MNKTEHKARIAISNNKYMKNIFPLVMFITLIFPSYILAQPKQNSVETERINRLIDLCKLWGQVKYYHPSLAYRKDLDWDQALIDAIPKVRKAGNLIEHRVSLQGLLNGLNDPATRISEISQIPNTTNKDTNQTLDYRITNDGILVISIGNYFSISDTQSQKKLGEITKEVLKAKAIVFDLRSKEPIGDYGNVIFNIYFGYIERLINTQILSNPAERSRVYYGYKNFSSSASGQYRNGFLTDDSNKLSPTKTSKDIPSILILNKNSGIFPSTVARQIAGKSLIVFEGKGVSINKIQVLKLGNNLTAQIKVSESIFADGTDGGLIPDLVVNENVVYSALKLARNFSPSKIKRKKLPITTISKRENSYAKMKYPSLEYRLLSAFRIWNVVQYFFPYKNLMDRNWETVLREFIPKFENAKNELEYTLTVAEMVTHMHDSHAYLNSSVYNDFFGVGYPPIRVRLIENKLVVTAFTDKAAESTGIELGDVVVKVDGKDAKTRLAKYSRYISASTIQSNMDKATLSFMNGKPESEVKLVLRKANGKESEVKLTRKREDYTTLYHRERTREIIKMLPGNIGYADLDRLTLDMLDTMFEKFKNTKAIIFDMRGYPHGTAWAIAPRLSSKQSKTALFETPIIGHNLPDKNASAKFYQSIQPTPPGKWVYKGKTVMLIDERAASQAEHTGMLLRAANGTKFIGSHTTGVNGEITTFSVPGAITIGFTGQSVRFPNGRQLQRIGLVPDLEVKPTINGIRAKRDEVLEKAMQYLNR